MTLPTGDSDTVSGSQTVVKSPEAEAETSFELRTGQSMQHSKALLRYQQLQWTHRYWYTEDTTKHKHFLYVAININDGYDYLKANKLSRVEKELG